MVIAILYMFQQLQNNNKQRFASCFQIAVMTSVIVKFSCEGENKARIAKEITRKSEATLDHYGEREKFHLHKAVRERCRRYISDYAKIVKVPNKSL